MSTQKEPDHTRVHAAHCCQKCGCRYGDADCPVVAGTVTALYDCEECANDRKQLMETLRGLPRAELIAILAEVTQVTPPLALVVEPWVSSYSEDMPCAPGETPDFWRVMDSPVPNDLAPEQGRTWIADFPSRELAEDYIRQNSQLVPSAAMAAENQIDAERFRKLSAMLQFAYEGDVFESESLDVYCNMQSGWRDERQMQAELRWKDVRDEPLNLGAAIDAAPKLGGSHVA